MSEQPRKKPDVDYIEERVRYLIENDPEIRQLFEECVRLERQKEQTRKGAAA